MAITYTFAFNMNLLTQMNEESRKSAQRTRNKVNRLPFSGFLGSILSVGITLALVFGAVKAFPYIIAWFRQMSTGAM